MIPMRRLRDILGSLKDYEVRGADLVEITGLACDSRRVERGNLFVCIKGFKLDGHDFLPDALARGAAAVVIEDGMAREKVPQDIPCIITPNTRHALADIACEYYQHPSRKVCLVGITGTNGKTTTAHLVAAVLAAAGRKSAVIGTLGAKILNGGESIAMARTTPESLDLQRLLAEFVDRGVEAIAMEVSSHSLMLDRVRGCAFDVAVFTNLTQDHLDFHESLNEYATAKARLFTDYADSSIDYKRYGAVINTDDPTGMEYARDCPLPVLTYGIEASAHLNATAVDIRPQGAVFVAVRPEHQTKVSLKLTGRFNVYNALAAFGVGEMLQIPPEISRAGLESVDDMPGRMQMIDEGQDFDVCVDYAHTPDGLEKILKTAREITTGQLIALFGCGGDRDPGKRPKMGAVATALSDQVVITSDNPRSEDPMKIIDDILAGVPANCRYKVEPNRARAIELALSLAQPGDFVVLAGKGHETDQVFKDRTVHFDDREVARDILRRIRRPVPQQGSLF